MLIKIENIKTESTETENIQAGEMGTTYIEGRDIPSIRYHIFQNMSFVRDGFSTRAGGVSSGQFESMNFSIKMGDRPENVRKNFSLFLEAHGFQNPVMSDQTHTANIKRVYREDAGKNVFLPKDYSDIDGLVTNEKGITLVTTFADCVPLYFADEKNRAIGLAHSGWKGTIGRIGKAVTDRMKQEFGTEPEDIKAAIGPSICVNCYEVSKELAEDFAKEFHSKIFQCKTFEDNRETFDVWDMKKIVLKRGDKYYLNLWAANNRVLTEAGIPQENIAFPDLCTCCNHEDLFSHRASRGKRGNLCAFFMIEE